MRVDLPPLPPICGQLFVIRDRETKLQKDNKKDPEDFQANSNELIRTEIIPRDLDEVKWTKMNYYRLTLGQKGRKIRRQNDDENAPEDIQTRVQWKKLSLGVW